RHEMCGRARFSGGTYTRSGSERHVERVCFLGRVKPERLASPNSTAARPTRASGGSMRYFTWTENGDEHRMRDLTAVKAALRQHEIELPSWAFGNSGTRFKVFGQPGVPRTPWEKAEDAAQVHQYTGVAPSMAVHIPWDKVDDYGALARHAAGLGIRIGAV